MIYILFVILILSIVFYGWGSLSKNLLNPHYLLSITLIKGILILSIIACITAFFFPLNLYFEILIITLGIIFAIYFKFWKTISFSVKSDYPYLILILTTAFVASMNPYLLDTFSYYFPTVKWLDDYGLVKGLANFDFNLGQQSLWHILQATFNESVDIYYKINAAIVCIYIVYIREIKKQQYLLFLPLFYLFIASPSADVAIFVLSAIIVINYISNKTDSNSIYLGFTIATFLILMKPIAFTLFLFFGYLVLKQKNKTDQSLVILYALFLGFLFFIKNYIISGNPFFPLSITAFNNFPHSVPKEVYEVSRIIGRYIPIFDSNLDIDFSEIKKWDTATYYSYFFRNLNIKIISFFVLTLIEIIFLGGAIFKRKSIYIVLGICLLLKTILIFYASVQTRFILDNMVILLCVILYSFNTKYINSIFSLIFIFGIGFVLSKNIVQKISYVSSFEIFNLYQFKFVSKPENYSVKTIRATPFNFESNVCTNYLYSIDTPQPSLNNSLFYTYLYNNYHPVAIDPVNIRKGFISKKNDSITLKTINQYIKKDQQ